MRTYLILVAPAADTKDYGSNWIACFSLAHALDERRVLRGS
jgi:hypothetical protein